MFLANGQAFMAPKLAIWLYRRDKVQLKFRAKGQFIWWLI